MLDRQPRAAESAAESSIIATGIASAVQAARDQCALRRALLDIERRVSAGQERPDDARRYRMARFALLFHDSPGRLPCLPAAAGRILQERDDLTVEQMVGATGPPVAP